MEAQVKEVKNSQANVTGKLNQLLADYQIFYQNLRGLHWNVKGSMFFMLHEKFEEFYNEAAETVDELAERILMIGGKPLHTLSEYVENASLRELKNISDGREAVAAVLVNSKTLLQQFRDILNLAEEADDEGTASLMSDLIGSTEKRIWMLSSYLA